MPFQLPWVVGLELDAATDEDAQRAAETAALTPGDGPQLPSGVKEGTAGELSAVWQELNDSQ
jgi:hypothetical protein